MWPGLEMVTFRDLTLRQALASWADTSEMPAALNLSPGKLIHLHHCKLVNSYGWITESIFFSCTSSVFHLVASRRAIKQIPGNVISFVLVFYSVNNEAWNTSKSQLAKQKDGVLERPFDQTLTAPLRWMTFIKLHGRKVLKQVCDF